MNSKRLLQTISILLLPAALTVFTTGCGTHKGEIGWVDQNPSPEHDYHYVKTVTGTASASYYFGMFGPSTMNVYDRAQRNLMKKADLKSNQRIINRTLDETTASFPPTVDAGFITPLLSIFRIYYNKTVYLSGEVIELEE